jgi:glycerol-3-phosphate dehydrogenase
MQLDAVIFGGGVAGLWLLDELTRRGRSALLLESDALGSGQTIASQGIIHGGLKYTLQGLLTRSARSIRDMPALWQDCLTGQSEPNLTATHVRSDCCYLWRTDSVASRLGMIGARVGLRTASESLSTDERPDVLKNCPGSVSRLNEQVISPRSFLNDLAGRHRDRILKIDRMSGDVGGPRFEQDETGRVTSLHLRDPNSGAELELQPATVVLTAGAGNAGLRRRLGLDEQAMQRRPLHMVLCRGELLVLNGHCVDGAKTRVTITSDVDNASQVIWQIGGQLSEDGVTMDEPELLMYAKQEIEAMIPGVDLSGMAWSTYRVDRAERAMPQGKRPETIQILEDANILTAWPTKLVLAPVLAETLCERIERHPEASQPELEWSRPVVAEPPWETERSWYGIDENGITQHNSRCAA